MDSFRIISIALALALLFNCAFSVPRKVEDLGPHARRLVPGRFAGHSHNQDGDSHEGLSPIQNFRQKRQYYYPGGYGGYGGASASASAYASSSSHGFGGGWYGRK